MVWDTLHKVRRATKLEFVPALAEAHHFVLLKHGGWVRTLGAPGAADSQVAPVRRYKQAAPRVWHQI
jgi:hypothetical protein